MNPDSSKGSVVPVLLMTLVVVLLLHTVISHERAQNRIVITTNGTFPWSFVTPTFCDG